MIRPVMLGMVGSERIITMAEERGGSFEQALGQLTRADVEQAALAAMPTAARAAYQAAKPRGDVYRAAWLAEQARLGALDANPHLLPAAVTDPQMQTRLSQDQTILARALFRRMAEPLSADEREICAKLGMSEAAYTAERNREIEAALPGWTVGMDHGLSADESAVAKTLGIAPDAYAASKRLAG